MLPEAEKMNSDVNGTTIKTEKVEIKEEVKEENKKQNPESNFSNSSSGPPSNKLSNGESDNNNQTTEKSSPVVKQENQPAQTLAEVLSEETPVRPASNKSTKQSRSQTPQASSAKTTQSPKCGTPVTTTQSAPTNSQGGTHSHPPNSADAQFMQQQSQIFVFSTQMANEAAETVMTGQYKNILSYHMDQPVTKKFLQKHPIKITPFSGQPGGPPQRNIRPGMMMKMQGGPYPPTSSVAQWVQQQNAQLQEQGYNFPQGVNPRNGNNPWLQGGPSNSLQNYMIPDGFDPDMMGMMERLNPHNPNLLHQKVPNENLTPEQLKKREESLTNLRKIQQMLFPEQRQHYGPGPGPGGVMQEGMPGQMMQQNMMSPPHNMMSSQQNMMTSPHDIMTSQGMMNSEGMMGSPNSMMGMPQFGQGPPGMGMGPHSPRGPGPFNVQNMSPAQRDWFRLQQEFYMEKRRHQQQQIAQRMGQPNMEMPGGAHGPPPSYFSSIAQKRGSVGINSSTSPNSISNGPLGSPPMVSQGYDPHELGMFPQRQRRSSFGSVEQAGMGPMTPGMPPGGANFEPNMMQNTPPGSAMMMGTGSPIRGRKNSQAQLQRVGNPEPFIPEIVSSQPASGTSVSKPPPSYAQSQKRKRSEIEEDLFKNLQPTPSPQQINYLNQFEGQELTITRQLNAAYREPNAPSDNQSHSNQFTPNQVPHSPMHGPASNKGPMSNSSQTSSGGPLSSPGPMSVPGPSPLSGANMRLSHYDPPSFTTSTVASNMNNTSVSSSAPATPTSKSSMSNITSSTLADLAKGVEHLSNQMQQNMMQGGPFHSIQMQGQQTSGPCSANVSQSNSQGAVTSMAEISSQTQTTPSVNNTFVNATMSIKQLNIHSVNAHPGGGGNYNAAMQVQQMNTEQQQMGISGAPNGAQQQQMPMPVPQNGGHANLPPGVVSSGASMTQTQGGMSSGPPNQNMGHPNMGKNPSFSQHQQQTAHLGNNVMISQQQHQQQQPGRMGSPSFNVPSSMGNANVQIQAKAPNTIQYLPAHPPANQTSISSKRPDLEFMQRFAAPMNNMEAKAPTSKMQYFPNPLEQNMRGRMSPYSNQPTGSIGPGGMPPQAMLQRGGTNGPDFPSGMGPAQGPGGPLSGLSEMIGNQDPMGGHMPNSISSSMNNMPPGMMPGPHDSMMQGNMRMSPGMTGLEGIPPNGRMGGMPHPNHPSSPPYNIGPDQIMAGGMMHGGPMSSRGHGPGINPMSEMMPGGPGSRFSPMGNYGPSRGGMPNMRMPGPGNPNMGNMSSNAMGGPGNQGYSAQYQQFQQQLYSQGRARQMSPMDGVMGGPGAGPGGQYMGMMSNMPGP